MPPASAQKVALGAEFRGAERHRPVNVAGPVPVEDAHRAGRKTMAHAEGLPGIRAAVRAGIDTIEHGSVLDDETAKIMAERGTWLVPTINTFYRGVALGLTQGQEPQMLEKGKAILAAYGFTDGKAARPTTGPAPVSRAAK